jgi:hypothetical protein
MQESNGPSDYVVALSQEIPEALQSNSALEVECAKNSFVQKEIDKDVVNPELVTWLSNLGLEIKLAEMFYCMPGSKVPDHFDDIEPEGCCKLIWTYGSNSVPLLWYGVYDQDNVVRKNNSIGGYYLTCDPDNYYFAESTIIKNPSLIRVDKLHGVTNNSNEPWCAVTLVLKETNSNEHRVNWAQLIEKLPIENENG